VPTLAAPPGSAWLEGSVGLDLNLYALALLASMVLLALAQGLLCAVAPDQVVRACSLAACLGASAYAACLVLAAWQ
jgi:hypothetical protein